MTKKTLAFMAVLLVTASAVTQNTTSDTRPRASDLGLKVGGLPTGSLDAITDVAGVEVGHTTIIRGDDVRTGVTAILPHPGNLFREKVPGAVFVGNAFGKLAGSTQVNELGEIETPILLTSTLSVPLVADTVIDYMLALPGNEDVQSINPLVGETNEGYLNDIRSRLITREDVVAAVQNAKTGTVEEGSVGAGTGTIAFGWKGGIGTASRKLPLSLGGYMVGVLVQTNFGGVLSIAGAPVGKELGRSAFRDPAAPVRAMPMMARAANRLRLRASTGEGDDVVSTAVRTRLSLLTEWHSRTILVPNFISSWAGCMNPNRIGIKRKTRTGKHWDSSLMTRSLQEALPTLCCKAVVISMRR